LPRSTIAITSLPTTGKNEKIVAVSHGVKEDVQQAFFLNPSKVEVIYNPIDVEEVRKRRKAPSAKGRKKFLKNRFL
jgi:hypothetical protein